MCEIKERAFMPMSARSFFIFPTLSDFYSSFFVF